MPVFYATDRALSGWVGGKAVFGGKRGDLRYGRALVTIPYEHKVGEIERPGYFFRREDADKHFTVAASYLVDPHKWAAEVQARAAKSKKSQLLLFVHGYNVTFNDALYRTAQISWDVKFDGPSLLFAWPSAGAITKYFADESSAQLAEADLVDALRLVLRETKAQEIYLIAHSMGNRVLTGALRDLALTMPAARARIKDVILAAPDIDADTFKRTIAPRLPLIASNITLYASNDDLALVTSEKIHGYGRVGLMRNGVTIIPPIVTIDASGMGTDLLGHSYVGDSVSVLGDIRAIIDDDRPPAMRGLEVVTAPGGIYWRFPSTAHQRRRP